MYVLKRDLTVRCRGLTRTGTERKIPVTVIRSPGFARSTSSSYTQRDTVCGVCPSGTTSRAVILARQMHEVTISITWSFLQAYDLTISKRTTIVDERHCAD